MSFSSDPAGWAQVIVELLAMAIGVVVAAAFYFCEYRRRKQEEVNRKRDLKSGVLAALRQELEMNWALLHNPPLPERNVYHADYFDPTRQVFKYRDDAIMMALSVVESDVLLRPDLGRRLLEASQAIRFVNQQIDELMAYRFADSAKLARVTQWVRHNYESLRAFPSGEGAIPATHRAWFQELSLRHWAIVNEGYWKRLLPALQTLGPAVSGLFQEAGLEPLEMRWREREPTTTAQIVGSSGSGWPAYPDLAGWTSMSKTGGPMTGTQFPSSGQESRISPGVAGDACRPFGDPARARVFVIGHDPRLQKSDTQAASAFFLDYLEPARPTQKFEASKYDLATAAVGYIEHLTGGLVPLGEMYFTNLCNEFLPHAPKGGTVLIPDDAAERGIAEIEKALARGEPQVIIPMSLQVSYHLARSGFVTMTEKQREAFLSKAEPKGRDAERGAYVQSKPRAFLEVCGERFLHGSIPVVPVLHVKTWPLRGQFKAYESAMQNAAATIQRCLAG